MKKNVHLTEIMIATLITALTAWALSGWFGLVLMVGTAILAVLLSLYVMRLIPGLSGDIYGAITTIVETLTLLIFTIP